ncbi:AraC family transcriptional regulator [Oceanicoccus sp. KOV_DT_Chl]|uniref:AraC family transcriptional regulator n=1 Tax=Oceanicoccus sp. KOV_DT_Chl TaxID=1904639 RepID=UPI0013568453|nr:AraC family transcriptional regulator [Oceanicoccus sp. KOV_DT_Chl]
MKSTFTVSQDVVDEVCRIAQTMGYSIAAALQNSAVSNHNNRRMPAFEFCHLLAELKQQSGDPDIGLKIGRQFQPSGFNILGYLVMASPNIGAALPLVQQFQQLAIDCAQVDLRITEDEIHFNWTPFYGAGVVERVFIDLVLSAIRNFGIWATGVEDPFLSVYFQYKKPHSTQLCEDIFGHPGHYNCASNGFSMPITWHEKAIHTSSQNLTPILIDHATLSLNHLLRNEGFSGRVIEELIKQLPNGHTNIDTVAKIMNTSARTLQRHLNDQNTSFSELLQSIRYQMANYFLQHTELPIQEISARVGYQTQSSFTEAYKIWSGNTPIETRQKNI